MNDLIGETIERYRIVALQGQGGMARVYKAEDTLLSRFVAIKVLQTENENSSLFIKRFEREAKQLAGFSHLNIVKMLDYGTYKGAPYLVMEYISGGTLQDRMGKAMSWPEACTLLAPIARALQVAHERRLVHRDIKPSNILFNEADQPMLSDFGIVKILEDSTTGLTATGTTIGTANYMSPEQAQGKEIDGRSDIYSLGVILYELITGKKPFEGTTPIEISLKHMTEPIPRPRLVNRDLPAEAEQAVFKAMAKKPDDRYSDMGAFARVLEIGAGGRANKREPQKAVALPMQPIQKKNKKVKLAVILTVIILLALSATGFVMYLLPRFTPSANIGPTMAPPSMPSLTIPEPSATQWATPTNIPVVATGTPIVQTTTTPKPSLTAAPTEAQSSGKEISKSNIQLVKQVNHVERVSVFQLDWSADGSLLAAAGGRGITLLEQSSLKEVGFIDAGTVVNNMVFLADSKTIIYHTEQTVHFADVGLKRDKASYQLQWSINSLAVSPDQNVLGGSTLNNKLLLMNIENGAINDTFNSNYGGWSTAFSPDGKLVASGTSQGTLMWEVVTGDWIPINSGKTDLVKQIIFSPDSTMLAAGSKEGLRVWDTQTGQELYFKSGTWTSVNCVAFSPDGRLIVIGSSDGYLRFFDAAVGTLLREVKAHGSSVFAVHFSPNGEQLASGANEGVVRLWAVP